MFVRPMNESRNRSQSLRSLLRFRPGRALGALVTVATLACGDSTSPESIEGIYALQTINGRALPVVVMQEGTQKFEVTAGAITLGPGTKWKFELTVRATLGADVSTDIVSIDGTWSRAGSTLTLTSPAGDSETVLLSGRTLTLQGDTGDLGIAPWVFRRS